MGLLVREGESAPGAGRRDGTAGFLLHEDSCAEGASEAWVKVGSEGLRHWTELEGSRKVGAGGFLFRRGRAPEQFAELRSLVPAILGLKRRAARSATRKLTLPSPRGTLAEEVP